MLIDRFGRQMTYMRISVTDRCNMRCVYCMPPEGVPWKSHGQIMTYEEIAAIVRVAAGLGIREIRLTGGEPLVRKDLSSLVRYLSEMSGIEDISMTTNALLLEQNAQDLAKAGLRRVNISLDTLRPDRFSRITRGGNMETAWRGIKAAEELGLRPLKFNVVAMRGVNDDEIVDMALLTMEHDWHVRFIELMPIKNGAPWGPGFPDSRQAYFPVSEIRHLLEPYGLEPCLEKTGRGPAREYRLRGAKGKVGLISPLGEHFCATCNRLRLTADGNLRLCLLNDQEIPLLDALRRGEDLTPYFLKAVELKPESHHISEDEIPEDRNMAEIGG